MSLYVIIQDQQKPFQTIWHTIDYGSNIWRNGGVDAFLDTLSWTKAVNLHDLGYPTQSELLALPVNAKKLISERKRDETILNLQNDFYMKCMKLMEDSLASKAKFYVYIE